MSALINWLNYAVVALFIFSPCRREQIFCRIHGHFRVGLVDGG